MKRTTPYASALPASADVVVVGSGFGGLATCLRLSELGARVVLCEALDYPGGCASTFERGGFRFEAGATLFSGFGAGQLFRRWIDRHALDVTVDWLDPVVELRTPSERWPIRAERNALIAMFCDAPGAPRRALRNFFDKQQQVANVVWSLLDEPDLLPPLRPTQMWRHAKRFREYLPLAPLVARPLESVLESYDVSHFAPLRLYLEALCQITVQCPPSEAEALFALGTMDYYFRGTGHVRGGIGRLATGMVDASEQSGAIISMSNRVSGLEREGGTWRVSTNKGEIRAPTVVANVLPQNLWELTGAKRGAIAALDELAAELEDGWGACMLYRVVPHREGSPTGPHHLELVENPSAPMVEGNHVFCSFSGADDTGRAPEGYRTLTVSTHIPVSTLRGKTLEEQSHYIAVIQDNMRRTMRAAAPEWEQSVLSEWTASPRTFQRFTKRFAGYVGGIPRRVGLKNYRRLGVRAALPGLYLVGDTVFPGQSTLATATGGYKLAEHIEGRRASFRTSWNYKRT